MMPTAVEAGDESAPGRAGGVRVVSVIDGSILRESLDEQVVLVPGDVEVFAVVGEHVVLGASVLQR